MKIKSILVASILVGSLNMVGCQITTDTCENCNQEFASTVMELFAENMMMCHDCADRCNDLKDSIIYNVNNPTTYTCENCGKTGLEKFDMYYDERFCEDCYMNPGTMNCTDCGGKFDYEDMHFYDGIQSCDDCFFEKVEEVSNNVYCRDCGLEVENCMCIGWDCINCGQWHTEVESYYNEDGMSACSEECYVAYTGKDRTEYREQYWDIELLCDDCHCMTKHIFVENEPTGSGFDAIFRCLDCSEKYRMHDNAWTGRP